MGELERIGIALAALCSAVGEARADNPSKLLWGDTHVHTERSVDAYYWNNRTADADETYRFAKGEAVPNPYSGEVRRLRTPLDFMAITDHAEYLGFPILSAETSAAIIAANAIKLRIRRGEPGLEMQLFWRNLEMQAALSRQMKTPGARETGWDHAAAAADRHNDPGRFTAFIGWEWTPRVDKAAFHRVILTTVDAYQARQFLPYSSLTSKNPEALWAYLARIKKATGADFIAIPHNSNLSQGRMFAPTRHDGTALTAQIAQKRNAFEMIAEVTQTKGTSETAPALSPDDEFAGFEIYGGRAAKPATRGDTLRGALMTGLEEEARIGVNPFRLGMIGSTDSHAGIPSAEEPNFTGHFAFDAALENKSLELEDNASGWSVSASGLAAVWARANTREDLMAAFRRREVYATTGPRITLRFFGGFDYVAADAEASDIADIGYAKGVPMGGDLVRADDSRPPSFLIRAIKDPLDGNLDRIQIVKGWVGAEGVSREKIFNVAWSGERALSSDGRLDAVGDTVDRRTAAYTNDIGAPELSAVWTDPEFDPAVRAFYYVRVIQIPTPRHSLVDAVRAGAPPPPDQPEVIQERAFSSPIWYAP